MKGSLKKMTVIRKKQGFRFIRALLLFYSTDTMRRTASFVASASPKAVTRM